MMKLRMRILAGAAAGAMIGTAAYAQDTPFDFSANEVTQDADERIIATGNVEVVNDDRTLRTDSLAFDPNTAVITANGSVQLYQPDGSVEYADSLIFNQDLTTGVATNFSAYLPEDGAIAAANIIRRDDTYTELNRGIFTACDLCDDEGNAKTPTWSVSAEKVVRDEATQSINYRNAVVYIRGVPVLYSPFFSHADPSADRKSGLLAPHFQHTDRRGLSWEQPWLWAISPYQDLVISPQINTRVSPFLNADWRRRFHNGQIDAQVGYTYERDFNSRGLEFGPDRSKAYILAAGEFDTSPNWHWGFTAERARDRRLFDQYSISFNRPDRGLYAADDRRLISQVYTVRQGERSYFSVAALSFQSLRPLPGAPLPSGVLPLEDDDTLPFVGPLLEFRYEPAGDVAGGRLRIRGSGALIERETSQFNPADPGIDTRRATLEADWRRSITTDGGVRIEPFLFARGDVYSVSDLPAGPLVDGNASRGIATAGVDISWPFIRVDGGTTTVVEPIIQIALSPDTRRDPLIQNEDSLGFEFDYTNLFAVQRFPGFDLYEGGQRVNVGVRTSFDWGGGRNAQFIVGQSFRADADPALPAQSGLRDTASDWIFGAQVNPAPGWSFFTNARFDDLDMQRFEAGIDASTDRFSGYFRYLQTEADYNGLPQEDFEGAAQVFVTENWGFLADAVRDVENDVWRQRSLGIVYEDDCLRFEMLYQRDNNPVLEQRESTSIVVRLTLATLGEAGYRDYTARRARAFR